MLRGFGFTARRLGGTPLLRAIGFEFPYGHTRDTRLTLVGLVVVFPRLLNGIVGLGISDNELFRDLLT